MRLLSDVASRVDDPLLRRAVELAERGLGRTAPNPVVGCVIVRDGRIVGEGFHDRAGSPHAEVVALAQAGPLAAGADVYVTLEPCRHHGKTPPCADALLDAGVRSVTIGMADPTAEAGGGAAVLAKAGVSVRHAEDPVPFAELNEGWIKRGRTGVPLVTAKVGVSLDGHSSLRAGQPAGITGASGAQVTQHLREQADAVAIGAATLAVDDPSLTRRRADGSSRTRQPLRVVIARSALPDPTAGLFADGAGRALVVVPDAFTDSELAQLSQVAEVATFPVGAELLGALEVLGSRGVNELLIEPGPRLLTALWQGDAIDRLVVVTAGGMAGPEAPPLFWGASERTHDALTHKLQVREAGIVGDVAVMVWRRFRDPWSQSLEGSSCSPV